MKTKGIKFLMTAAMVVTGLHALHAQTKSNDCSSSLIEANKSYESGHFKECLEMMNPCANKLNPGIRFEAWRLLALAYINLNDEKNANQAVVNLLHNKPDYQFYPYFDQPELTHMIDKYEVWPSLELGLKAGFNYNTVSPIKNYSVTGSSATFNPLPGFQAGIFAEYFFRKNLSFNAEFLFEGLNYSRTAADVSGWSQDYREKLYYYQIPVTARYYFYKWNKFTVGAEIGLQMHILSSTNSNISLVNNSTGENIQNTIDASAQRNKVLLSALAGLSVKYKLGGGNLGANIRFAYGFSNVVNADKRYDNLDFILSNQYVDSDIAFNPVYFSLSYQVPVPYLNTVKLIK